MDEELHIEIIRSRRKTYSISVDQDGKVTMRVPMRAPKSEIQRILKEREDWIRKHVEKMGENRRKLENSDVPRLTRTGLARLTEEARSYLPERVKYYAQIMGVTYGRITIRHQKSRWGSCSAKGSLNFNCLLMLAPAEVIDYVVVHELSHRRHMDHSREFWAEVGRYMPDYKEKEKWLKVHGQELMYSMRDVAK
ncbi:MAG: SprT family zinc-dependent metalloprotease [Eubacterium sp.]|nr:SprT family zinc-dependent metalloprotease [Eubacterium sp.]